MEDWTAIRTEYGYWLFSWTAGPTDIFTVWLNGIQIDTVTGDEYECKLNGYVSGPPPLEIVDDADDAENDLYPPFAVLQWREVSGAAAYLIEQYIDSAWTTKKTIMDKSTGYYWYRTAVLTNETEYQFRVSALNKVGNPGTPVAYTFEIEHNPAAPDVAYTIDGSNDLIVSEA